MKIKKKIFFFWGGGGSGRGGRGGRRVGGQGGCEWRSKVFVKIRKKKWSGLGGGPIRNWGGGGGGSKVWGRWVMWGMGDVNKE